MDEQAAREAATYLLGMARAHREYGREGAAQDCERHAAAVESLIQRYVGGGNDRATRREDQPPAFDADA